MDKLLIKGPVKLNGEVTISKAKNAYLPLMAACILAEEEVRFKEVPKLRDIGTMNKLLSHLGVEIKEEGSDICYHLNDGKNCCRI